MNMPEPQNSEQIAALLAALIRQVENMEVLHVGPVPVDEIERYGFGRN